MRRLLGGWLAALLVVVPACSADQAPERAVPSDTLPAKPELAVASRAITPSTVDGETFTVLVTSDEGIGAAGLDAAVSTLVGRPGVEVVVVAPSASGRSATGTTGERDLVTSMTIGGYPAQVVHGTPVDAIHAALDQRSSPPDLVVVGVRTGQTFGSELERSGGVAAARAAADRGVPALVVNAEVAPQVDLAAATIQLTELFDLGLDALVDGAGSAWNLNVPTCMRGMLRGRVEAPVAGREVGDELVRSDCTAAETLPHRSDADAFRQGFATLAELR